MRGTFAAALAVAACGSPSSSPQQPPDASKPAPDSSPPPDAAVPIPIKHVVVIVKENHTFDNYFGSFPNAEGIDVIMTPNGPITPPHAPDSTPRDLCHQHSCALTDYQGNWLDVTGASQNGDNLVYAQYHESDIPN